LTVVAAAAELILKNTNESPAKSNLTPLRRFAAIRFDPPRRGNSPHQAQPFRSLNRLYASAAVTAIPARQREIHTAENAPAEAELVELRN
jgi:hypothetical protein